MTTVVNNPGGSSESGGGMGFFLGMILLVVVVLLFLFYGLPFLQNSASSSQPQINVPDKVDVNVQPPAGGGQPAQPSQ